MSPKGSSHLREMKTSTNGETIKAPSNFSEMVNGHFKLSQLYLLYSIV